MKNTKRPHTKKFIALIITLIIVIAGLIFILPGIILAAKVAISLNDACGTNWKENSYKELVKNNSTIINTFQSVKILDTQDVPVTTYNDISSGDCTTSFRNVMLVKTFSVSETAGTTIDTVESNLSQQGFTPSPQSDWLYFYSHECNASVATKPFYKDKRVINLELNNTNQYCDHSGNDIEDTISTASYRQLTIMTVRATTTLLPE